MFQESQEKYEEIARFAAEGELALELQRAKADYAHRTGEMFETDGSFERRIASFLEWYLLDRKVSFRPDFTPVELFCRTVAATRSEDERRLLSDLTRTRLSLFEFKRAKNGRLLMHDLLSDEDVEVESRATAGLVAKDVLEVRLVPWDGRLVMSDCYYCHPRGGRRNIQRAAKRFRELGGGRVERIQLVHRVAFLANRCERYKHVNPKQIFAELVAKAA